MASAAPSLVIDTPANAHLNGDAKPEEHGQQNGHVNGVLNGGTSAQNEAHLMMGTAPMTVADHPVENFRPIRVIAIGAGFSGIYLSIRLPEWLRNVSLTVYEKNADIGGTWFENRYPGCACDIPSHSYVYTFEPNPGWKAMYASAEEIHQYLSKVADKYSARRFIKTSHKVMKCTWDETKLRWKVDVQRTDTGETFTDEADVLVSARGGLNEYIWPQIDGLRTFKGKLVHSATWDNSFDYSNKRIGVIGSGSSAIQIVPQLQKLPDAKITSFIRSKTWIAMPFGSQAAEKLNLDHDEFTKEDQEKLMSSTQKYHTFRKVIETEGNAAHPFSLIGSAMSQHAREGFTQLMRHRLAKRPDLADFMIPSFAPGCRRLTPGPGFLEALTEDNVEVATGEIGSVNEDGVKLADGRHIELDVLVCATGFNAAGAPPFPIIGRNGKSLNERFDPFPEAYLSVATDGFPNLFSMLGPNSGVASGSLTKIIEATGDYILRCVRKLQKEDYAAMEVKPRIVRDWNRQVQSYFKRTVFMDECKTWYRKDDRIIGLWPGSTLHAVETLRSPRWEDFEYSYRDEGDGEEFNRMAWLGNGWSDLQLSGGDLSWYIEPENVDFPACPLPEETERWRKLSFTP